MAKRLNSNPSSKLRKTAQGYALLMVCFLAALIVISTAAAAQSILSEGRRAKEAEMIWRGEQYARAVRLYYRKYGRFPQSFEDLTEPKGNLRFLRKAYADPMNRKDGTWRLIYVGPNGELIGSVKATNIFGRGGAGTPGSANPFGQPPRPLGGGQPRTEAPATPPPSAAKSPGLEGKVFGGNIIGVASKIEQSSFRVYKGATTYKEWEFIWDPAADGMIVGPAGSRPQGPPAKQLTPGMTPQFPPLPPPKQ